MNNVFNKTLEKYKNLAFLIKFYCFQEELKSRINTTQKENKCYTVYFLKKKAMVAYKSLFDYTNLCKYLQNKKDDILKDIKDKEEINYDKLNDSILANIIEKLPKDYLKKIDKLDNKKLKEIEKEDKKIKFIDNYIEYKNTDENKIVRLKIFKDFDIIDLNIINSLDSKLDIEMNYGKLFILPEKKILIQFNDNGEDFLYEIVNADKNFNITIEYLFRTKEINNSKEFTEFLFKNGISKFIKNFKNNEINNIIANYEKINKNEKIYWYKYNEKNLKKINNEKFKKEEPIEQKKIINKKENEKIQGVKKKEEDKKRKEEEKKRKEQEEKKRKEEEKKRKEQEEKKRKEQEEKKRKEQEEKKKKEQEEKKKKEQEDKKRKEEEKKRKEQEDKKRKEEEKKRKEQEEKKKKEQEDKKRKEEEKKKKEQEEKKRKEEEKKRKEQEEKKKKDEEKKRKEQEEKKKKDEEKKKKEIIHNLKNIMKEIKIKNKKECKCDEKLKSLILLIIYQKILKQSQCNNNLKTEKELKEIFIVNKKFLEKIDYFKVEKIIEDKININNNKNELPLMQNNITNFDEGDINKLKNIIINLDDNEFNELQKYEKEIKNKKFEFKDEFEEITIYNNKKLKIYNQFLLVDSSLYYYFEENFKIKAEEQKFVFKFVNQKIILKKNSNAQYMIFIVNFGAKQCSIEYILDYNKNKDLEKEFNDLIKSGIEKYFNEKMMFNKEDNKNDITSPIISDEEIIGCGYKYNSNVKEYINADNRINYLKNDTTLMQLVSLYSYYKKLEEKLKTNNNSNKGKYYLINEEFLIDLKIKSGYKMIYDDLEEHFRNINIENFENDIGKNAYFCIKTLPKDILDKYLIINFDAKSILKENPIEPKIINTKVKKEESVNIFTNFEIIEKKIIEKFMGKYENEIILSECYFNNGKIIINLHNYLNPNNFVSLIGILDAYSKYFIIEYILIYNFEDMRKKHLDSISNRLETYLNSLQFKNDSATITLENSPNIIGTIIKYNNDDKEDNNNKSNNNGEIQIDNEFNTDKPYIKDNFTSPPKIGLQNIGATCYMNSTLQCFSHIDKFVEFFKYNKERKDIFKDEKTLSNSFKILIENLWPNNFNPNTSIKYYAPYNFKDKISKMNPLFEGIAANDAKDLVNFIIMTLHLELNILDKDDNENISEINDQKNKELLFINFLREYENNNKSIISDLFYAINYNKTKCLTCGRELFNFQTYFFITFPLEEVRKYNLSKSQNNMNIVNNNCLNISQIPTQNQMNMNSMNMATQNQMNMNSMNMATQNQMNMNSMNMLAQNQMNMNSMNMPTQNQMNMNSMNMPTQSQMNMNSMNMPTQSQMIINSMNMPTQNQMNMNSMNMPAQNQMNVNSMNMVTQSQMNINPMNMAAQNQINNNYINSSTQNQMNMNMYNMNNQNNIINNNNMCMSMPTIQMPYSCNPQYNINSNFNNQQNQSNNNIDSNEVSIIDCFEYDKRDNVMSGDNLMYCSQCKIKCESIMNTLLETGPEILIILLNRGKGMEFDVKIKFDENLDLEKYIESKKYSKKYKLIGVITHIGESSMDGHFISYCREPFENGGWNKYNDAFVSKVEDFKKEVIDFAMPYVLFYQREKNK